jgi:hypothetical protein
VAGDFAVFQTEVFFWISTKANLGIITDCATVEVDKLGDLYVLAQLDVV